MKKLNRKKGFTIVELVIVIAVVGVLTAVLVPTFVNLTSQARKAENQTFVKNLNTQMGIREATEGKNKTMYEAMMEAEDIGFNVEKLTPFDGNDVVWDEVANRFAIVDKDGNEVYSDGGIKATSIHQLWKAYDSMPSDQTYSIYAKEGWKVRDVKNLKVGFDPGKNKGINVEYGETSTPSTFAYSEGGRKGIRFANEEVGKNVIIRTNDSNLKAVTSTDGISHYGHADKIDIDSKSYAEYGTVAVSLEMKNGSLSVEPGAYIEELNIPEVEEGSSVSVSIKSKGTVRNLVNDSDDTTIDIETESEIGQVIGSTEKITGTGAAEAKRDAALKVTVGNAETDDYSSVQEAIDDDAKYITLTSDLSLASTIAVHKNLIIDGNNYTITANGATRMVWIDEDNVSLKIKDLILDSNNTCDRGVQVNSDKQNYQITLENVQVINNVYYAINMCGNTNGSFRAIRSKISGWGALNLWSEKYSVYVADSELYGLNDKNYDAEGWNDFGTVVLEGDTTGKTNLHSSEIDVRLVNTKIYSEQTTGNKQYHVLFNDPSASNVVTLDGCTFFKDGEQSKKPEIANGGSANKVYIDGELIQG